MFAGEIKLIYRPNFTASPVLHSHACLAKYNEGKGVHIMVVILTSSVIHV